MSIINLFTETGGSTLKELYRPGKSTASLALRRESEGRGDPHLQWAGLISHSSYAPIANYLVGCGLQSRKLEQYVARSSLIERDQGSS